MKTKPAQSKAWSEKEDAKARKLDRKRKKELKRITQNEKESDMVDEDSDDLENDFKLLKKLKKGKVTQEEFDKRIDLEELTSE